MEPQRYGPFPYRTARDLLPFRWPGDARLARVRDEHRFEGRALQGLCYRVRID